MVHIVRVALRLAALRRRRPSGPTSIANLVLLQQEEQQLLILVVMSDARMSRNAIHFVVVCIVDDCQCSVQNQLLVHSTVSASSKASIHQCIEASTSEEEGYKFLSSRQSLIRRTKQSSQLFVIIFLRSNLDKMHFASTLLCLVYIVQETLAI